MLPTISLLLNPSSSSFKDGQSDNGSAHIRQSHTMHASEDCLHNTQPHSPTKTLASVSESFLSLPAPCPEPTTLSPAASPSLPPLEGYDPPRVLRRHSFMAQSHPYKFQPWVQTQRSPPAHTADDSLAASFSANNSTVFLSPQLPPSPSPSPLPSPSSPSLFPASTTESNASLASKTSDTLSSDGLPPPTQIVINDLGEPVLKRRRGRPPLIRGPVCEGGWTFLTPTVWDVTSPTPANPEPVSDTVPFESTESQMTAAFTSATMETVLEMPKKKRGRKPKNPMAGNSCFMWKDIPSVRRSSRTQ